MDKTYKPPNLVPEMLGDAIGVLLRKTCRHCSKALQLHAVGHVAIRSQKSWTSSATMALELMCPQPGGFQHSALLTEMRLRIVAVVDLAVPKNPISRSRLRKKSGKGNPSPD